MYFITQVVLAMFTIILFAIRNKSIYRALSKVMARVPFLETKLLLSQRSDSETSLPPRRGSHMPRGHTPRGHTTRASRALGELVPKYKRDPSILNDNEPLTQRPEE